MSQTQMIVTNMYINFLPQNQGLPSSITIRVQQETAEVVEDENGMVIQSETFLTPDVPNLILFPRSFHPYHITQCLDDFISETGYCQVLGQCIASNCAYLRGPFILTVDVKFNRHIVTVLSNVVTVPSNAAPDYVLQRLVEEQRVTSRDFEEGTCSICIENLSEQSDDDQDIIRMPSCSHMFHQGCIFEWLGQQNSCPLCRKVPYAEEEEAAVTSTPTFRVRV